MLKKNEEVRIKVHAENKKVHLLNELHRLSSGYIGLKITNILNKKFKSVITGDGELRKKFLANDFEIVDNVKDEVVFELIDNSIVTINIDFDAEELVFGFEVQGETEGELEYKMISLRETVLHFVRIG